eukprot:m51a1_g11998 hypothetical protein (527) ;mRNA; r:21-3171
MANVHGDLRAAFESADRDGDGRVNIAEVAEALREHFFIEWRDLHVQFAIEDEARDGAIGLRSFSHLVSCAQQGISDMLDLSCAGDVAWQLWPRPDEVNSVLGHVLAHTLPASGSNRCGDHGAALCGGPVIVLAQHWGVGKTLFGALVSESHEFAEVKWHVLRPLSPSFVGQNLPRFLKSSDFIRSRLLHNVQEHPQQARDGQPADAVGFAGDLAREVHRATGGIPLFERLVYYWVDNVCCNLTRDEFERFLPVVQSEETQPSARKMVSEMHNSKDTYLFEQRGSKAEYMQLIVQQAQLSRVMWQDVLGCLRWTKLAEAEYVFPEEGGKHMWLIPKFVPGHGATFASWKRPPEAESDPQLYLEALARCETWQKDVCVWRIMPVPALEQSKLLSDKKGFGIADLVKEAHTAIGEKEGVCAGMVLLVVASNLSKELADLVSGCQGPAEHKCLVLSEGEHVVSSSTGFPVLVSKAGADRIGLVTPLGKCEAALCESPQAVKQCLVFEGKLYQCSSPVLRAPLTDFTARRR